MALREIRTFDDPVLRKKSRSVQKVDDKIRELLKDMADTMYHTPNGGGLAACQVGILKRLVVIDLGDGLLQLVNPEITEAQGEQTVTEGCLSFPNVWARLRRPARVTVKALNEQGQPVIIRGEGLMAKCLCHELDHLDGIVFTDKADSFLQPRG